MSVNNKMEKGQKGAKKMTKYIVCLSSGDRVCVEANSFDVDYSRHRVLFSTDDNNIAVFNFTNIQGFYQEYTSEEKEQSK